MSKIFISHSSKNNAQAIALRDWLGQEGWNDIFLDIDPDSGIAPGERWEKALQKAAFQCEVVIFIISEKWIKSPWCLDELHLAHHLGKQLFGILIEDIPKGGLPKKLTQTWQLADLARGTERVDFKVTVPLLTGEKSVSFSVEGLNRLKAGLKKAGLDANYFEWPPKDDLERSPFPGLKALEEEDAGIFFGRDGEIIEALDKVRRMRAAMPPRMLVILGASGAGKSSFMRAGLLPRLKRDNRNFYPLPIIRPEKRVLGHEKTGFIKSLGAAFKKEGFDKTEADIRLAIEGGIKTLRPLLALFVKKITLPSLDSNLKFDPPTLILPIDQGEELFLAEGAMESNHFLDLLSELLRTDRPAMSVLLTIRSDSYDRLQSARQLDGIRQQTLSLPPMPLGNFEKIITAPAKRVESVLLASGQTRKLEVEPQLVSALLSDVQEGGSKDALPLLAFTLERLYTEYGSDGDLTLKEYEAFGKIEGSIETAVDKAFELADHDRNIPLDESSRNELLRRGFVPHLAAIDPESRETQRRVTKFSYIPEESRPLIELLVKQRLLSTDVDEENKKTVEPTHEALLRQWPLLKGWLNEDEEDLIILEGIKTAAKDWDDKKQDTAWVIHKGARLVSAERVAEREDFAGQLGKSAKSYLKAARQLEKDEEQAENERRKKELETQKIAAQRGKIAASIMGLATVAMGLFGWLMYGQWQDGLKKESMFLADLALKEVEAGDSVTAKLLALEGLQDKSSNSSQTSKWRPLITQPQNALYTVNKSEKWHDIRIFNGHTSIVRNAVFSPDGKTIATIAWDWTARLWDVATGKQLHKLQGHTSMLEKIQFSPNGKMVLTLSENGTAILWDVATGKQRHKIEKYKHIVFSLNSKIVLIILQDDTAKLWKEGDGEERAILEGHIGEIESAVFSSDSKRIITAASDKSIRIWKIKNNKLLKTLKNHTGVTFSSNGENFISIANDSKIKLWDVNKKKYLKILGNSDNDHEKIIFSPDNKKIAIFLKDNEVRFFEVKTRKQYQLLSDIKGSDFFESSFSPDARLMLIQSNQKAKLWDIATGKQLQVFGGSNLLVRSAIFSPDGKKILTGGEDYTARLWQKNNKIQSLLKFKEQESVVSALFSSDGKSIFTTSDDIKLRDVKTGKLLKIFEGDANLITKAISSPDGKTILTASGNIVRRWNVQTGKQLELLKGHKKGIRSIAFSPNQKKILTTSRDHTARIWMASTGEEIRVLKGHEATVTSGVFSPDGTIILTGSYDGTARLWNAKTGKQLLILRGHTDGVQKAVFSPNSRIIVTVSADSDPDKFESDNSVRLWNVDTGKQLHVLRGHTALINDVIISDDSNTIVTASADDTARVWDVKTGKQLHILKNHTRMVTSLAFASDGRMILTASDDHTVRLWETKSGKQLAIYTGDHAVFSPNEKLLLTNSDDGTVRLWDISKTIQQQIDEAKKKVSRCLTPEQREKYHLSPTPPPWCYSMNKWPYKAEDAPSFWKTWSNWIYGIFSFMVLSFLMMFLHFSGRLAPLWKLLTPILRQAESYWSSFKLKIGIS